MSKRKWCIIAVGILLACCVWYFSTDIKGPQPINQDDAEWFAEAKAKEKIQKERDKQQENILRNLSGLELNDLRKEGY